MAGPALSFTPCSHLYPLSLSRPGLSLWQVPPGLLLPSPTSLSLSFSHILHCYLPLYPLSTSFILARLVTEIGPALCLPFLSPFHIHTILISITLLTYISLLLYLFWPGLSLWQVPPTSPTFQHLSPPHPPDTTFPLIHLPLRYTVARLVIVAGPAISSYPCTFLTPPSPALPPTDISLQAPSTASPSYRPGLPLWLVSPFPYTYFSSLLFPPSPLYTHLLSSYLSLRTLARLTIVVGPAHPSP